MIEKIAREHNYTIMSEFLRSIAEPTRLKIVHLLANGEKSVTEIAEATSIPLVNISHHLGCMKAGGVVTVEPKGRSKIYKLACFTKETIDGQSKLILISEKNGISLMMNL